MQLCEKSVSTQLDHLLPPLWNINQTINKNSANPSYLQSSPQMTWSALLVLRYFYSCLTPTQRCKLIVTFDDSSALWKGPKVDPRVRDAPVSSLYLISAAACSFFFQSRQVWKIYQHLKTAGNKKIDKLKKRLWKKPQPCSKLASICRHASVSKVRLTVFFFLTARHTSTPLKSYNLQGDVQGTARHFRETRLIIFLSRAKKSRSILFWSLRAKHEPARA